MSSLVCRNFSLQALPFQRSVPKLRACVLPGCCQPGESCFGEAPFTGVSFTAALRDSAGSARQTKASWLPLCFLLWPHDGPACCQQPPRTAVAVVEELRPQHGALHANMCAQAQPYT